MRRGPGGAVWQGNSDTDVFSCPRDYRVSCRRPGAACALRLRDQRPLGCGSGLSWSSGDDEGERHMSRMVQRWLPWGIVVLLLVLLGSGVGRAQTASGVINAC